MFSLVKTKPAIDRQYAYRQAKDLAVHLEQAAKVSSTWNRRTRATMFKLSAEAWEIASELAHFVGDQCDANQRAIACWDKVKELEAKAA